MQFQGGESQVKRTASISTAMASPFSSGAAGSDLGTLDGGAAVPSMPDQGRSEQRSASTSSLKASNSSMQYMVVLVTTDSCRSQALEGFAAQLSKRVPQVGSVVHSVEARTSGQPVRSRSSLLEKSRGRGKGRGGRATDRKTWQQQLLRKDAGRLEDGPRDIDIGQGSSSSSNSRPRRALAVASSTTLAGAAYFTQELCGLGFNISPHSFFQTNTEGAELLYRCAISAAKLQSQDVVLDLYCGTGTIGLVAAEQVKQVIGFDCNIAAIADARDNAARNGIGNASFFCGDLDQLARGDLGVLAVQDEYKAKAQAKRGKANDRAKLAENDTRAVLKEGIKPDVVIVDPARAGLGSAVAMYLLGCGARRVVYVSCNAATQARDLQLLCSSGDAMGARGVEDGVGTGQRCFKLTSWTAVDMFPQTGHVETVAVLER
jgi:SAM-dependent methyltransferase